MYVAHSRAFPGQDQDFFQALSGNSLHFRFYFSGSKLGAFDIVVAVKAAVDAVIFAVVGDIKRGEQIDALPKCLRVSACAFVPAVPEMVLRPARAVRRMLQASGDPEAGPVSRRPPYKQFRRKLHGRPAPVP
mgnify:CR=1 FL=1